MKPIWHYTIFAAAGLSLFAAQPALADVKAGVDAWSAGDYARAVAEWREPAAKGDPDALFNMAQAYRLGRGVAVDLKKAQALYAQAAAKGHLKAADNYGLLLFQDGKRREAMPYIEAAAGRGDPRAQYLLGIAHFNGDLAPKDWERAYALLTLANGAGLPQARPALQQMDEYVPLAQRQAAQSLVIQMRQDADATRASQMAAADLAADVPAETQVASAAPSVLPRQRPPEPVESVAVPPSRPEVPAVTHAQAAVAEAMRATGTESPAHAGADFAMHTPAAAPKPVVRAIPRPVEAAPPSAPAPKPAPAVQQNGPWKVQLGAFSVAANADKLWSRIGGRGVLSGKAKFAVPAGRLTRLLAGGWPTSAAAQSACNALKAAGQGCIVTR
ncbi:MAG: SPOR domain-containing protein [Tsuneonella suprasediminis]|nr:SPOR domain-containing protein [Altererythrobacter sp. N1]